VKAGTNRLQHFAINTQLTYCKGGTIIECFPSRQFPGDREPALYS
jgi:hypothetical protein